MQADATRRYRRSIQKQPGEDYNNEVHSLLLAHQLVAGPARPRFFGYGTGMGQGDGAEPSDLEGKRPIIERKKEDKGPTVRRIHRGIELQNLKASQTGAIAPGTCRASIGSPPGGVSSALRLTPGGQSVTEFMTAEGSCPPRCHGWSPLPRLSGFSFSLSPCRPPSLPEALIPALFSFPQPAFASCPGSRAGP